MESTRKAVADLEDAFIKVTFEEDNQGLHTEGGDPMYDPWVDHGSGKFTDPAVFGARALRKIYPGHHIVPFYSVDVLGFPDVLVQPVSQPDVISSAWFVPLARRLGQMSGVLVDLIKFGTFRVAWNKYDFLLCVIKYPFGFGEQSQQYLLHEGAEEPARALLVSAGIWSNDLHEEIYVFDQGYWQKSHGLWLEVQKGNWADVILKEEFKTALKKDVYGFFDSEDLYKSLAIPWKRGLIMYGPPGNGKTISMKVVMKESDAHGYAPLYVKSFRSWMGEEGAMALVFEKARQMAPCVLILEDLDSLINDGNRSFFLNQLDGLEGNDGLLVIGSTNHFDRLDPALSGRPSRFDRKYLFDDPDQEERALYAKYWQNKLKNNIKIYFPDALIDEVASITDKFSFAYLKEAFVATLVVLAGLEGDDKPDFAAELRRQVQSLRDQLSKDRERNTNAGHHRMVSSSHAGVPLPLKPQGRVMSVHDSRLSNQSRIWSSNGRWAESRTRMPGEMPDVPGLPSQMPEGRRDVKDMAMAAALRGRSFIF